MVAFTRLWGLEEPFDLAKTSVTPALSRDSAFEHGHLHKVFLGSLYAFCDGCSHLACFSKSPSDDTITVTYHDDGSECERTSTLCHLCDTVDSHEAVF